MSHPYFDGPYPRAYAHRGWHVGDLAGCENTEAAFVRAAREGLGYVELDVHASADGVPMVHHDPTLDRTTDATGRIDALPADVVGAARVGGREPVPRLESVLAAVPGLRVTIELKSDAVVAPTLAVLERLDAWDRVCLGAFDESRLVSARAAAGPRLCTSLGQRGVLGLRGRGWADLVPVVGGLADAVLPTVDGRLAQVPERFGPLRVVDRAFVARAHRMNVEVHVWTVDDPADMRRLLDLGVDGLLSDRPDLLRDVVTAGSRAKRPDAGTDGPPR